MSPVWPTGLQMGVSAETSGCYKSLHQTNEEPGWQFGCCQPGSRKTGKEKTRRDAVAKPRAAVQNKHRRYNQKPTRGAYENPRWLARSKKNAVGLTRAAGTR
jgi:hypothetical protein